MPEIQRTTGQETAKSSQSEYLKTLTFAQFLRSQNEDDIDLILRFAPSIPVPEGWSVEDHINDFYPSIWLKNGSKVVMIYGAVGEINACLGELRKPTMYGVTPTGQQENSDIPTDFTMVFPILPPEMIPHEIEEDGEKHEDFETAVKKLQDFEAGCIEYLAMRKDDEERKEDEKASEKKTSDQMKDSSINRSTKYIDIPSTTRF